MKLIKFLLISAIFLANNGVSGQLTDISANKIADCIYKLEGGAKTKYPYGIKSINTFGNQEVARRICLNTIKNNYVRWVKTSKTNDFLNFLADKYCPPSCDKQGNLNWKKNINKMIDAESKKMFN